MGGLRIPDTVARTVRSGPGGHAWLEALPGLVDALAREWSLTLGAPFEVGASCAWVAPATRHDGGSAVLKVSFPHMEARDEIAGLRFWAGDPTVRLLDADPVRDAMLLERCTPGNALRAEADEEQDRVLAGILRRLWRRPPPGLGFRPLSEMVASWRGGAESDPTPWPDAALARAGFAVLEALAQSDGDGVLLATDLHAGNVLRAERRPWLAIDPKPFVGDPSWDATQHLLDLPARLCADAVGAADRFAARLEVDAARVRGWLFARVVMHPWRRDPATWSPVVRALAP